MSRCRPQLLTWVIPSLVVSLVVANSLAAEPTVSPFAAPLAATLVDVAGLDGSSGFSIQPVYYGEVFTNTRGGMSTSDATQYQALFNLACELDLEKTAASLPGKFFLLAQNTHGRGLTQDFVGDAQVISNIDSGGNIMRVSEYWWEFGMLDDNVTVRLGKQDVNTEFLYMDSAEDFVHSAFGLTPALALPTYPDQSMGAVVLTQLTDSWELKLGVWDALAFGGGWGISANDAVFAVAELEHKYALLDGALPGTLALGGGYLSAGEISGMPLDASHGYLFQIEQLVWRERACDNKVPQGAGVFFSYVPRQFSGRFSAESLGNSYVSGLVYRGLLPGRDDDVVGAGVAGAELFRGGTAHETVFEFFYKVQVTPRIALQPDLQYIASPSGIYRDALAAGVRFQLNL